MSKRVKYLVFYYAYFMGVGMGMSRPEGMGISVLTSVGIAIFLSITTVILGIWLTKGASE